MGPYPFALAAALVAGLLAGLALGTVRLTRLSLGWWRSLRTRWKRFRRGPAEDDAAAEAEAAAPAARGADEPQGPPGPFPRAHGAVLCATIVAALALLAALRLEPAAAP